MANKIVQPDNFSRDYPWKNALPYLPNVAMQSAQPYHFMLSMPLHFTLIPSATAAVTNTSEMQVLGRNMHAIQVACTSGTMSATVLVEATVDMVNWVQIDSITAPGIKQYSGVYASIRASMPTYTSGTISVTGLSQRS